MKSNQWALIERAYGEYEITLHATKKDALLYIGTNYVSRRIPTGYEVETDESCHIVCKATELKDMGYDYKIYGEA